MLSAEWKNRELNLVFTIITATRGARLLDSAVYKLNRNYMVVTVSEIHTRSDS